MSETSIKISEESPAIDDTADLAAKKNLERYAVLVWRIYSRCARKPIDRNLPDG